MDYSFVLHLDRDKIPGVKSIKRIPDVETLFTKTGKMYAVKYYVHGSNEPKMIRFTSKDSSFRGVETIDICNAKLEPVVGFELAKDMDKPTLLSFVGDLVNKTKYSKHIKENAYDKVSNYLQESPAAMGEILKSAGITKTGMLKAAWNAAPEAVIWSGIFLGLMLMSMAMKYRYYFRRIRNWISEKYVSGPLEEKVNAALFAGQKEDEPAFAEYHKYSVYIKHILRGKGNALIICGPPGMSKTYIVRRTLHFSGLKPRADYVIEKGASLGLPETYELLYDNRKKILILDDFDTPLKDENMVNMLKAISDTYERRILSLPRESKMDAENTTEIASAPNKFEFEGKLIIITNLLKKDLNPALVSRAPVIEIRYNPEQVIKSLATLMKYVAPSVPLELKQEVYNYIVSLYNKDKKNVIVDFRAFKSSIDARVANPIDWKHMVQIIVGYTK